MASEEPEDGEREIEALSSRFEAVKIAMTQDKNGFVLKLSIHPNDTPEDILRDLVGTRYLVVAVRIGEDEQIVKPPSVVKADMNIKMAAALCKDERFQVWLVRNQLADEMSERAAAAALRKYCNIQSRAELKSNKQAADRFLALRAEFVDDLRHGTSSR